MRARAIERLGGQRDAEASDGIVQFPGLEIDAAEGGMCRTIKGIHGGHALQRGLQPAAIPRGVQQRGEQSCRGEVGVAHRGHGFKRRGRARLVALLDRDCRHQHVRTVVTRHIRHERDGTLEGSNRAVGIARHQRFAERHLRREAAGVRRRNNLELVRWQFGVQALRHGERTTQAGVAGLEEGVEGLLQRLDVDAERLANGGFGVGAVGIGRNQCPQLGLAVDIDDVLDDERGLVVGI